MDKAKTDPSDAELIAEIRQSLGAAPPVDAIAAPATALVEKVKEAPIQPAPQMPDSALCLADQLLGEGILSMGSAASTKGGELVVKVEGRQFSVPSEGVELGRSPGSDGIVVDNPRASRHHARFVQSAGGIAVMDLGSTNGTVVARGDDRLAVESEMVQLALGDRVMTLNGVLLAEVVAGFIG